MTEKISEKPPELIHIKSLPPDSFGTYHKSVLTKARRLTQADFDARNGVIKTLEGSASFTPGDYLAVGAKGEEYPIRAETMARTKEAVGEPDENGWINYKTTTQVRAAQIDRPFQVQRVGTEELLSGKAGDWFVDSGKRQFIVDGEIFQMTYEVVIPVDPNSPQSST